MISKEATSCVSALITEGVFLVMMQLCQPTWEITHGQDPKARELLGYFNSGEDKEQPLLIMSMKSWHRNLAALSQDE